MEILSCCHQRLSSFNRTFMELKFLHTEANQNQHQVLIVPLWNWNRILQRCFLVCSSFNRTFMELKFNAMRPWKVKESSFNRTFMELKWSIWTLWTTRACVLIVPLWNWNLTLNRKAQTPSSFNRTFMELKLITHHISYRGSLVLIVPLWNWNVFAVEQRDKSRRVLIVPLWNWNNVAILRVRRNC